MRKYYVDIFYCKRKHIKKAIGEYLAEIERLGGIVCPSVMYLNGACLNPSFDFPSTFRLFSVQRGGRIGRSKEVRVVINLVCEVNHA